MGDYRVLGTSDEVDACQECGTRLKKAVVLGTLDADGNVDGETYVGSDCAEKMTGTRAATIRQQASAADVKRKTERAAAEYNARLVLDAYLCVQDDKRELYARFWNRNPALHRQVIAGLVTAKASVELEGAIAQARAVLPDHQADMAPHRPQAYQTSDGHRTVWAVGCKCGRSTLLDTARTREDAERVAPAAHDALLRR